MNDFGVWHNINWVREKGKLIYLSEVSPPQDEQVFISYYWKRCRTYTDTAFLHVSNHVSRKYGTNFKLTCYCPERPHVYAWMNFPDSPIDNPSIWESAAKKLPSPNEVVLVYYIDYKNEPYITAGWMVHGNEGKHYWHSGMASYIDVRYWMYFPKPYFWKPIKMGGSYACYHDSCKRSDD